MREREDEVSYSMAQGKGWEREGLWPLLGGF